MNAKRIKKDKVDWNRQLFATHRDYADNIYEMTGGCKAAHALGRRNFNMLCATACSLRPIEYVNVQFTMQTRHVLGMAGTNRLNLTVEQVLYVQPF